MRYETNMWQRNLETNVFTKNRTEPVKLGARVLHSGVDTIRQLYKGTINPDFYKKIKTNYDDTFGAIIEIGGIEFKLGSGGASGYQYRLQNNHIGLILLFCSKYTDLEKDADKAGNHLKIEVSPELLYERNPVQVQNFIDNLTRLLLLDYEYSGLAIHLCADVQDWDIPEDFFQRFVTRSRRVYSYEGFTELKFDLNEVSAKYGENETITFGNVSGLQFSIYDKDLAAKRQDKIHFWESIWKQAGHDLFGNAYDENEKVKRIELRFHHSVIKQFSDGYSKSIDSDGNAIQYMSEEFNSYAQIEKHIKNLWYYGLLRYRLQYTTSTIDPFWQQLIEDCHFNCDEPHSLYKREYKKPSYGSEKNVVLALGNLITLYARKRLNINDVLKLIENTGIWEDILSYYQLKGLTEEHIKQHITTLYKNRFLIGKA